MKGKLIHEGKNDIKQFVEISSNFRALKRFCDFPKAKGFIN